MADPKAPDLATCEPLEELEWFCPHCGVLRVRLRCEADTYATNVIDEDGCCAFCGYTCCRMSEVRSLLSAHGLAIVSEADRKVIEAMSVIPETLFKKRAARACPELDAAIHAEAEARKMRAK